MQRWILVLLAFLLIGQEAHTATISLQTTQSDEYRVSDTIKVNLVGLDFTEAALGGGVSVTYDPRVLAYENVSFDNSIFDFKNVVRDEVAGMIGSILVSADNNQPIGDFIIASIEFTALEEGRSPLDLGPSEFLAPWLTFSGTDIDPSFVPDGTVTITVVPLPSAFWLMLSCLGWFGMLRRHKV